MKHLLVLFASVAGTKSPISTTPSRPLYPTADFPHIPTCDHHTVVQCGLGLTRIIGELRKLGITKISRQTVRNILKEHGIEPSPDRTSDSWADFLARHGETLWACDFFSVKSVTSKGIRDLYVLVFLCLKTREVIVTESTVSPDSAWVCQQTEWFAEQTKNRGKKPEMIIHDRDVKFTKDFTKTVKDAGMKTNPLPKGSPNLKDRVAYYTSFVQWVARLGNVLRSESFRPWFLVGAFASRGSNRHSFLSL